MYFFVTPEDVERQKKYADEQFMRSVEESQRKQKAKDVFRAAHPKCPHCGHEPEFPVWLTF